MPQSFMIRTSCAPEHRESKRMHEFSVFSLSSNFHEIPPFPFSVLSHVVTVLLPYLLDHPRHRQVKGSLYPPSRLCLDCLLLGFGHIMDIFGLCIFRWIVGTYVDICICRN